MANGTYPLDIRGELDAPSRALWIIKLILAIPHYIILFFLYIAYAFVWIFTFFAVLFTGKHPKGLFDFKLGVLRWSWRVGFYTWEALGTDKYPPFSLDPDPNYPADLDMEYKEQMSRGLVLIKWWLLAIPHYIITSILIGGWSMGWDMGAAEASSNFPGLVTILAFFAAIALLFTGNYPHSLFKLILGMNRWGYRVAAYASLMTDEYPPFRLWDD